jgi:hypothetical protein
MKKKGAATVNIASVKEIKKTMKEIEEVHKIWKKFHRFLINKYGEDCRTKPTVYTFGKKKVEIGGLNEFKLSKKLVGYDVMQDIEKYAKRNPDIKVIRCDDAVYASSMIVLIPHPKHGITMMFIPQCTEIQNRMFLYKNHFDWLMEELNKMKNIYKGSK